MVAVYELNSNRNYIGAPFDYNGRKIAYSGQTQQGETTDWRGNRIRDTKYIFNDVETGESVLFTDKQVANFVPVLFTAKVTMGGRMMRRQRSQRRGHQQRRQRTQRRQRSQRRGRKQRRQRTQRRH